MDSPYAHEIRVATAAIQQAAKLSQKVIVEKDKGVLEKDDLSPVTVADFAVQALLTATIHAAFPDDRFVGEESADELRAHPPLLRRVWELLRDAGRQIAQSADAEDGGAEPLVCVPRDEDDTCALIDLCHGEPGGATGGRAWIFDPIDGTKMYVAGRMYAINVALLVDGREAVSVVGLPVLAVDAQAPLTNDSLDPSGRGTILFGARGHGAFVRPLRGSAAEVEVRRLPAFAEDVASVEELRSVACWAMLDSGVEDVHKAATEKLGVPFPGSDLLGWVPRWCVLAMGLGNMTIWVYKSSKRQGKIWDHAGAMMLFGEVGGKITDVDGKDIDAGAGRIMKNNHGFVAAPKKMHALVLKTVQEVLVQQGKADLLSSPPS